MIALGKTSIAVRLGLGFGAMVVLLVIAQVIAASRVSMISGWLTEINDVNSVKQRYAINFRGSVHDRAILMRDLVLFHSPRDIDGAMEEIRVLAAAYEDSGAKLDALMDGRKDTTPTERAALGDIKSVEAKTLPLLQRVMNHATQKQKEADIDAVLAEARPLFSEWLRVINVFIDMQEETNKAMGGRARGVASSFSMWMLVIGVCAAFIGLVLAGWTVRSIARPIAALQSAFGKVGDGDLRCRAPVDGNNEFARLSGAFNQLMERMHGAICEVSGVTNEVASAATQIAASSDEMSAAIGSVAQQTSEAAGTAQNAGTLAAEGGQIVNDTVERMKAIDGAVSQTAQSVSQLGKYGEQIGQVIAVINDIADQTNLLALNAAIEAARAGEHGRGFAVVADEVRKLADRTTKATDEIAGSIKAIQAETTNAVNRMNVGTEHVRSGVDRAVRAGASLEQIVSGSSAVAALIGSISEASKQAGAGAGQSASAASQLSAKALQLQNLVGRFKIDAQRSRN